MRSFLWMLKRERLYVPYLGRNSFLHSRKTRRRQVSWSDRTFIRKNHRQRLPRGFSTHQATPKDLERSGTTRRQQKADGLQRPVIPCQEQSCSKSNLGLWLLKPHRPKPQPLTVIQQLPPVMEDPTPLHPVQWTLTTLSLGAHEA